MAEGANIESLSLEISVNTKDAAGNVRLLKNALDGLERTLRHISNLHVRSLFKDISESGKQAAAEVQYNAEQVKKSLDRLIASTGMKDKLDTEFAMRETFDSFERQIANLDSKMAASDWQEQMANGFRLMQSAGTDAAQSFNTIHDAADQSYTLADAMRMVRGAMGSVSSGTTTPLNTIKDAAEQAGEQVRDLHKEFMGLARSGAQGIKGISFDKDKLDKETAAIRERNAAIREASLERPNGRRDLTANAQDVTDWASQALRATDWQRHAPSGESLVRWLKDARPRVEAEGAEVGRIAAEAVRKSFLAAQASSAYSFELFGNTATVHISPAYEEALRQAWRQTVLHAKAEVDTEEGGGDTRVFQSMGDGISASFGRAIEQTRTFQQVSGTLSNITQVLSPALQAAGVSAEAFGAAMTAAAGPISVVVIAIQLAVKAATFLADQFKEFVEVCKKFVKVARDLNERFNPFESIKKELASILALAKRQILRRAINAVIKAVTEGLKEGVGNLAEFDAEFGATIQSFKNSMGLFKNSIGVAVAPIISYFIPALNSLLAMLTRAMNMIARLTALLTGKHTYTIAKDYQELGDSAGGAAGKVKELQRTILGFDEINRLNGNNGSGGGGGGGAGDAISAYETMDVGEWPYDSWGEALLAFVTWLRATGVPKLREGLTTIADTVNSFATNLYDALTFDGVQENIRGLGADIGNAFNNFLSGGAGNGGLDWEAIGRAIGAGIQTALNFVAGLVLELDFVSLGRNFATMLGNALGEISPQDLATVLLTPIRAAFGIVVGFILEGGVGQLAQAAADFVNALVGQIADMINGVGNWQYVWDNIVKGILIFVYGVDWDTLFGTVNQIVDGLFRGLNFIIKKLSKDPRVKQLIQGLIETVWNIATGWLKVKINAAFSFGGNLAGMNLGTFLFGSMSSESPFSFGGAEFDPGQIARDLEGVADAATTVTKAARPCVDTVASIGTAATTASSAVETATGARGITGHLQKMATDSGKPISEFAGKIDGLRTDVVSDFSDTRRDSATHLETLRRASNAKFASMYDNATRDVGAMSTDTARKFMEMAQNADSNMGSLKKSVVDKISQAKSELSSKKFEDVGKNISNGVIDGMGDFKGKLDQWAGQFKKRILDNFAIKSPSRWARDMVGNYITEGIAVGMEGSSAVADACAGLKEGITSEFDSMSFFGRVRASANRSGGADIASAIGDQVTAAMLSAQQNGDDRPIVCEVYLDRDRIATAVTRGQQAQNRRYSPTALAY